MLYSAISSSWLMYSSETHLPWSSCAHANNYAWKNEKPRHSYICSILLVPCWLTVTLSDKTEAQANTHSPHLADHFPLVLVCQKQQPRLSFHLNPKLTSKVWPARALQCWELPVKLKENKQWTKFPLGQMLATFFYTKSYITSQAAWVHRTLNRSCIQDEVPST